MGFRSNRRRPPSFGNAVEFECCLNNIIRLLPRNLPGGRVLLHDGNALKGCWYNIPLVLQIVTNGTTSQLARTTALFPTLYKNQT